MASLNHFTCPCAIRPTSLFGVLEPLRAPTVVAGLPSVIGGQEKTPHEVDLARRCSRSLIVSPIFVWAESGARFTQHGGTSQPVSTIRVTGREPFRVPSQPGIAIEKRPAVPPATMTWISSGEGNFEIIASAAGGVFANWRFVPSPCNESGHNTLPTQRASTTGGQTIAPRNAR